MRLGGAARDRGTTRCTAGRGLPLLIDSFVGILDRISRVKQGWDSDVAARGDPAPVGVESVLRSRIKE